MSNSKTQRLRKKISEILSTLDLPWYVVVEVLDFFQSLHYYKLKNVRHNIGFLVEYLQFLDLQNTKQIQSICLEDGFVEPLPKDSLLYFVSENGLSEIWESKLSSYLSKYGKNWYQIKIILLWMQWILLLNANEFCHASSTRISLKRFFLKKQKDLNLVK